VWEETQGRQLILGPEDAPLRMVEFMDYTCAACRGFQSTLDQILRDHPMEVSITIHYPPVGPEGAKAASAAICSELQGRFQQVHRQLLETENLSALIRDERLPLIAARAGVADTVGLKTCMGSAVVLEALEADSIKAAQIRVPGTPSMIVDGGLFVGVQPRLPRLVERLLSRNEGRSSVR